MSTDTHEPIVEIPVEQILESRFNPRRIFTGLEDLAANIKAEGRIHEPLLVRFLGVQNGNATPQGLDCFELVFGHRRLRAAPLAGLATVPCMVREMSDAAVRSAQVAENLQRDDVHPIEEAEAFRVMVVNGDATADELAERFGRSRTYVYSRLKLLQACKPVREACLAGTIKAEVALLIARLGDDKVQEKALAAIKSAHHSSDLEDGGRDSYRAVRDLLVERFTLELKGALFDPADATLVPDAGTCGACPKRSGNAPEFADVVAAKREPYRSRPTGADVCTDPDCFAAKKAAHLAREAEALRAKGKVVVAGGKARQAISAQGEVKGKYVELTPQVREALKKVTGDNKPVPVAIQNPRDGKVKQAVAVEDLKAAGVKLGEEKKKAGHGDDDWKRRQERERVQLQEANDKRLALVRRVHEAAAAAPRSEFDLRLVTAQLLDNVSHDSLVALHGLWGVPEGQTLEERLKGMAADELALLLLDCTLISGLHVHWLGHPDARKLPPHVTAAAQHYGVAIKDDADKPAAKKKAGKKKAAPQAAAADKGASAAPADAQPQDAEQGEEVEA
jgi:ParB/RepB/Spo0J family partition protein